MDPPTSASIPRSRSTAPPRCGPRGTCRTCRGMRPASSTSRSTDARRDVSVGAGGVHQPRATPNGSSITVRDDTGWLNVWVDDHAVGRRTVRARGPVLGNGTAVVRGVARRTPRRLHAQRERLRSSLRRRCPTRDVTEIGRGVHGQLTWVGDRLAAIRTGARTPTQIVVYDTGNTTAGTWERRVLAVGPVVGWDAVELPEPEVITVDHDGTTLHARRYIAGDGPHAVLDPRRTHRPMAGRVPAACRLLVVAGVGRARARSRGDHRPRPRLPAGPARRMGSARCRRHGRDRGGVARTWVERPGTHRADGRVVRRDDGARRARAARRPRGGRCGPVSGHRSRRRRSAQPSLRGALHAFARRSSRRRRALSRAVTAHVRRPRSRYRFSCSTATPIPSCRSNRACGSSSASVLPAAPPVKGRSSSTSWRARGTAFVPSRTSWPSTG